MEADEIIERFCLLQQEVVEAIFGYSYPADCFCGSGAKWEREGYDGTVENGYRNAGKALDFIESAVREKIERVRYD